MLGLALYTEDTGVTLGSEGLYLLKGRSHILFGGNTF